MSVTKRVNEYGIGLVEVIFALGVSIVVMTSLVSLSLFTLRSSLQSKLMLQGTKLATQELEMVRALRDAIAEDPSRSWEDFIDLVRDCNSSEDYCYVDPNSGFTDIVSSQKVVGSGASAVTIYFYATEADGSGIGDSDYPNTVRISVEASWDVGGYAKHVYNYTDLSNWR